MAVHFILLRVSRSSFAQSAYTSSGFVFSSSTEMGFSSDSFANFFADSIPLNIPEAENEIDGKIHLEPYPLATLPPNPFVTDEEFVKEANLMMTDSVDAMDEEPPAVHDPE
ncbi:uncharacterized protein LOC113320606 [Papaver somniferum]|uniref:uncharacterized protein LOC113320606 n=1 Tax=Papaver somniferum TaxID=3469 RepID=UPI000E703C8B|nr:uncharacterized protein LOC113320606 [Papaver somniferum]